MKTDAKKRNYSSRANGQHRLPYGPTPPLRARARLARGLEVAARLLMVLRTAVLLGLAMLSPLHALRSLAPVSRRVLPTPRSVRRLRTVLASGATDAASLQSPFLQELQWRGFISQTTDLAALDALLASERETPVAAYLGFDATASSLHVGSVSYTHLTLPTKA